MPEFLVDRRDIDFVLFEQLRVDALSELERYKDFAREDYDQIIDAQVAITTGLLASNRDKADDEGCKLVDGQVIVPVAYKETYKEYAEGGWIAISRDPEVGGMGLPFVFGILMNELGVGADPSFMFYPGLTVAAGHVLSAYGTKEMQDLVVPKMYSGEWTGTMCLTEPQAGTAVGDIRTTATPIEGTNEYSIVGNKIFISAGDHQLTENIVHLVLARIPGDAPGTKGISLFLVPKHRYDADGKLTGPNDVVCTALEHKMGIHGSSTCALSFGDNGECRGVLVGERSKGIVAMFQMMNEARISCGVQGSAVANACYQTALAYAKERVQGAKITKVRDPEAKSVRIIEHPDVRRNLLTSKAYGEGLRALLFQAAIYADLAEYHPDADTRTKYQDLMDLTTPICKAYATDKGFKVSELAIQVLGGYGYVKEYGVEQHMRDVKIASLYEGTNGVQALDLLGRKMRLKGGGLFMTWMQEVNEFVEKNGSHAKFGELVKAVDKGKGKLGEVAFHFMNIGKEDPEHAMLGATPFLEMFGHVEVARLLVEQAVIADTALNKIYEAQGVTTDEEKKKLLAENADAAFYANKEQTARFFVYSILPQATAIAKEITSGDRSPLDMIF